MVFFFTPSSVLEHHKTANLFIDLFSALVGCCSMSTFLNASCKTQIKQMSFLTGGQYTAQEALILSTSTEVKKDDDIFYAAQSIQPVVVASSVKHEGPWSASTQALVKSLLEQIQFINPWYTVKNKSQAPSQCHGPFTCVI